MKLELRRVTVATPGAESARRDWPERHSLLLRLSHAGWSGLGEASPLPGYSPDTLEATEHALSELDARELEPALDREAPWDALRAAAQLLPRQLPSARLALETALLDLLGQQRRRAAPALLGAAPGSSRELCELIGPAAAPGLFARAERALAAGYQHLKVKLGAPGQLERELSQLTELRARVGASVALRADANAAFGPGELERAWPRLQQAALELFEEPGDVPPSPLEAPPLALDESLQGLDVTSCRAHLAATGAQCVVLKPTALGGLHHCFELAQSARSSGLGVVISHCFDGPLSWRAASALALALPAGLAHGLAPHAALEAWPGAFTGCVQRGKLEAWTELGLGIAGAFD
jgi:L-alanine-DL-glutamate epimerase-like enolase superfamily enzyme